MTTQTDLSLVWADGGGQIAVDPVKYSLGWVAEIPSFQNFNYVLANATKNILVAAEQGVHGWEAGIQYQPGARVIDAGLAFTCHTASLDDSVTGAQPSLDSTFSYWVTGIGLFGPSATGDLEQTDGILLDGINTRVSATAWGGNDLTMRNDNCAIAFNTTAATDNWLMANVSGEMVLVNNGTVTVPNSKSIAPGAATVSRIFHEAHPPTQAEVAGTIDDGPQDGEIYGRQNSNWVKVTSTTVSEVPPNASSGNGAGWYNLDDATLYVDIDDSGGVPSSQWVPASPPTIPIDPYPSRNFLDNGNIDIKQRGLGPWSDGYTADRWLASGVATNGASVTFGFGTPSDVSTAMRLARDSAGTVALAQRITGPEAEALIGHPVTVSFNWAAEAGVSVTELRVRLSHPTVAEGFGTLTEIQTVVISSPEDGRLSATFNSLPANTTLGLLVAIDSILATSGGVVLSQLKMEFGPDSTPYAPKEIATELTACQRWYQVLNSSVDDYGNRSIYNGSAGCHVFVPYSVTMKTAPTSSQGVVFTSGGGLNWQTRITSEGIGATVDSGDTQSDVLVTFEPGAWVSCEL